MQAEAPSLFGHPGREAILLYLAKNGPSGIRPMARALEMEQGHSSVLVSQLCRLGVLCRLRGSRGPVEFNPSFFAFDELQMLFHGMLGQRVIIIRDPRDAPAPNGTQLHSLFFTRNRTRFLIALAVVGSASLQQFALLGPMHPRSVRITADHFDNAGITRSQRMDNWRVVEFDPSYRYHTLVLGLLRRLAEAFPDIRSTAEFMAQPVDEYAIERGLTAPSQWDADLMPLGDETQARVLYELAHRGPMTTFALSRTIGKSIDSARSAVLSLFNYGLLCQRTVGTGRLRKRWAALNPQHPITAPFAAYVRELVRNCPAETTQHRLPPAGFPHDGPFPQIGKGLPGKSLRLRIILGVFENPHGAMVSELAARLRAPDHRPIKGWLEHFRRAGMIDYGLDGAKLRATPNPRFSASRQLYELVRAMRAHAGDNVFRERRRSQARDNRMRAPDTAPVS